MSDIILLLSESSGKIIRARAAEEPFEVGDYCLVESEYGGDLAIVIDTSSELVACPKAAKEAVKIIRRASPEDIDKFKWLREKEKQAFDFCLQRIKFHNLPMKLVAVRYFFNEKKGIFYYTADGRIDFRQLVKDLAKELKMRIEMRQIGSGMRPG
jgi:cell fate regulator YaaT (PSP1 superfamily)